MLDKSAVTANYLADETALVRHLINVADLSHEDRRAIADRGAALVRQVRTTTDPTIMEHFLAEYGLSTEEGVALMCLAEALLRVPDATTIDDLIADKIAGSDWDGHSGQSSSVLVNASTWALMLTGRVLSPGEDEGLIATLGGLFRRLGEPVIRTAVGAAMRELGDHFVLGQTIQGAIENSHRWRERGYTFSYDMLGEGARTDADARRYHLAYADAITEIARHSCSNVADSPGISVKLSALHPRYEATHRTRYFDTLLARTRSLAVLAAGSGIGFNIDAEEADRLEPSLELIDALLREPALAGWDGLGVVVQAYGRRAEPTLDWLYQSARRYDRRIMVRLVKGAYWDTEIKRAQVLGLSGYPVFTRKAHTDVAYLACAQRLLQMGRHVYPQFATHNAHTVAAVLQLTDQLGGEDFELQRLHGMGEALHEMVRREHGVRCRIYAPVGVHKDLLAYLVRRLLENGANSSFVHQIVDESVPAETVAADPITHIEAQDVDADLHNPRLRLPCNLYADRLNSAGWDLSCAAHLTALDTALAPHRLPARPADTHPDQLEDAVTKAARESTAWARSPVTTRAEVLERASELYESNMGPMLALLAHEAHKTLPDAIAELREAVDFLRYYAAQARAQTEVAHPRGVFACISPWNFPLAIFTGQIAAALVSGNTVVAKPAEQTPRTAQLAVQLMHQAGVPADALQLVLGDGTSGALLTAHPAIDGVCFTGSLDTARRIERSMAEHLAGDAPLIAETGGVNVMIVDSTALPEQAVRDIVSSAFQSAGQRCSALRVLYLQQEVATPMLDMIQGAMDALVVGDPRQLDTDVGPVIDEAAYSAIRAYLTQATVLHQTSVPSDTDTPNLIPPTLVRVTGIDAVPEEVFGPVLHVATFKVKDLDRVLDRIDRSGYGLTFAIHTRLDDRVHHVVERLRVGNIYVNRNQIGAVVGTQPFGGEGLSGTGPKAGGPNYLARFCRTDGPTGASITSRKSIGARRLNRSIREATAELAPALISETLLPGPTGERNVLRLHPRGCALILGPGPNQVIEQLRCATEHGCPAVVCAQPDPALRDAVAALQARSAGVRLLEGFPTKAALKDCRGLAVIAFAGDPSTLTGLRQALAQRDGPIIRLTAASWDPMAYMVERHVCIDTTAAGGNASLMSGTELA